MELSERNKSLDGVRALSTLGIILYHLFSVSGQTINNPNGLGEFSGRLNVAVSIFFVLSGYLLFRPFVEAILLDAPFSKSSTFYLKRFVRIIPAYWVALLILWKIDAINFPNFSGFIRSLFLIHTFTEGNVLTGIAQTWTLSVEVFFYLCLPWIAMLIRACTRNKTSKVKLCNLFGCLIALYASAYVFRVVFHLVQLEHFETHAILLPAHFDTFALGMLVSAGVVTLQVFPELRGLQTRLARLAPVFFVFSGATWFWSTQIGWALDFNLSRFRIVLFGFFLYGIASVCFVIPFCLDSGTSRVTKIFGSRLFVWLGTISYGMYLWHFLFLVGGFSDKYMPYEFHDMGIATRMLITIPGTIAIASLSYYLIERPLLRALSRTMQKRKIQNHLM
jgi:peptidoglycan/LPS O-acetylase OafA/YrhL